MTIAYLLPIVYIIIISKMTAVAWIHGRYCIEWQQACEKPRL